MIIVFISVYSFKYSSKSNLKEKGARGGKGEINREEKTKREGERRSEQRKGARNDGKFDDYLTLPTSENTYTYIYVYVCLNKPEETPHTHSHIYIKLINHGEY